MTFRVPFMKPYEIEEKAADLLREYAAWKGSVPRPPINIDDIVEGYLKLDLEVVDLEELLGIPDVLGATWFEEKVIRLDSSLEGKEGRLTFTLAHEVGHWRMHRFLYERERDTFLFRYRGDQSALAKVVCQQSQQKEPAEWQANQFAAQLLMPSHHVRAAVKSLFGDRLPAWEGFEARRKSGEFDPRLKEVAGQVIEQGGFSNVSNEAVRYRLLDLGLVVDASSPQQLSLLGR